MSTPDQKLTTPYDHRNASDPMRFTFTMDDLALKIIHEERGALRMVAALGRALTVRAGTDARRQGDSAFAEILAGATTAMMAFINRG